jgi:branched-chain amino acid transport system ATP-binding protein
LRRRWLAPVVVYQLLTTLKRPKEAGVTILLVEQNVHLALALSDYAYVVAGVFGGVNGAL